MFDLISTILAWLYSVWPSFGGSIMLLTLGVMLITTPLTLAGTKSMIKMQRLQPDLKAVQEYYKDDKELQNQQVMAFYQANGINPVGGCLPMFIQMPVFIVLYQVIRGVTRRVSDIGVGSGFGAGLGAGGNVDGSLAENIDAANRFNPQYLDADTQLYRDLATRDDMPFLRVFDLADTALDVISNNFVDGLPYILLILVVGAMGFWQQRQIQGRQRPGAVINPQQQAIMKFMPFFLPIISFNLQAALVIYFLVSNLYRLLQQGYITRTLYSGSETGEIEVIYPEGFDPKNAGKKRKKPKTDAKKGTSSQKGSGRDKPGGKGTTKSGEDNDIRPASKSNGSGKAGRIGGGTAAISSAEEAPSSLGGLFGSKKKKGNDGNSAGKSSTKNGSSKAEVSRTDRGTGSGRTTPKGTVSPRPRKKKR